MSGVDTMADAPALPRIERDAAVAEYWFEEGCHISELWNDPADELVSVARARVAPGDRTRLHLLEGITERYVVIEGTGRVEVGDRPPGLVRPGDVVVIPPGVPQRIANTGTGDLVFLAVCTPRFTPDAYRDIEDDPAP